MLEVPMDRYHAALATSKLVLACDTATLQTLQGMAPIAKRVLSAHFRELQRQEFCVEDPHDDRGSDDYLSEWGAARLSDEIQRQFGMRRKYLGAIAMIRRAAL